MHSDKEEMIQEEEDVLNQNNEVFHADEEGNLNNTGSLQGIIDSYPQIYNVSSLENYVL